MSNFDNGNKITNPTQLLLTESNYLNFNLRVELLDGYYFLEHVYDFQNHISSNTIISCFWNGDIVVSNDLGEHFKTVVKGEKQQWKGCFTTNSNKHLLWDSVSQMVWVFSKDWGFISKIKTGNYMWHGSWSIGETEGTIMYAEYADAAENLYVWKSVDDGLSWSIAFSIKGNITKDKEIRHFHTIQPDPYVKSTWYLSSGDYSTENRIWISSNNGISWTDITDPTQTGPKSQGLHRYTAIIFKKDYIYWGTDDNMNSQAKLVKTIRSIPLHLETVCDLGNSVRSAIMFNEGAFFISESKTLVNNLYTDATIHYSKILNDAILFKSLPNLDNQDTGFTYSRSSIAVKDSVFFTYFGGHVLFPGKYGSLRWTLTSKKKLNNLSVLDDL